MCQKYAGINKFKK